MNTQGKNVAVMSANRVRYRIVSRATPGRWIRICLVWAMVLVAAGWWGCSSKSTGDAYLIRVGDSMVTVAQFKVRVEAASEEAFPGELSVDPEALNDLRVRTLNQLTEQLIIMERAEQIGVQVTDEELEQAVQAIKGDYPDDTFEKTLLENAVSFGAWKKKMATRMLVDKVIARELVNKVKITSGDVSAYFQAHYPDGPPEGEDPNQINKRIVRHLRQQKAETMYQEWIDALRQVFTVDINQQQWDLLVAAE